MVCETKEIKIIKRGDVVELVGEGIFTVFLNSNVSRLVDFLELHKFK